MNAHAPPAAARIWTPPPWVLGIAYTSLFDISTAALSVWFGPRGPVIFPGTVRARQGGRFPIANSSQTQSPWPMPIP